MTDRGSSPKALAYAEQFGTLIGWHGAHYLYLLPSVSYNTVARFAKDEGRHFGTKERALWKALVEEGVLDKDDDDHTAVKVMIRGESRWLLRLHRAAVARVWSI